MQGNSKQTRIWKLSNQANRWLEKGGRAHGNRNIANIQMEKSQWTQRNTKKLNTKNIFIALKLVEFQEQFMLDIL